MAATSGPSVLDVLIDVPADANNAGGLSAYGTMGQGRNVWEWTEDLIAGSLRALRGGDWDYDSSYLAASSRHFGTSTDENYGSVGFRVASVPKPSSITLLIAGAGAFLAYAWRRRKHTNV
jgi:hypothetical protein